MDNSMIDTDNMSPDTIRENLRMYARVIVRTTPSADDINSLIKYAIAYRKLEYGE